MLYPAFDLPKTGVLKFNTNKTRPAVNLLTAGRNNDTFDQKVNVHEWIQKWPQSGFDLAASDNYRNGWEWAIQCKSTGGVGKVHKRRFPTGLLYATLWENLELTTATDN